MTRHLAVLSLGGGVQSSTLLLMACAGELAPPNAVIFSDTHGELPGTYGHLNYLRDHAERAGIRFLTVSAGDLRRDVVARHHRGGQPNLPVRVRHRDGRLGRLNHYRCSYDYKRRPITRAVKQLCGPPGAWKRSTVEQWIGFSTDEIARVKPADECRCGHKRIRRATSTQPFEQIHDTTGCHRCTCTSFDPWQVNRWPLIELGLSRDDCHDWLRRNHFRVPERSACWFCPNRPASHWRWLRHHHPQLWTEAVALDDFIRHGINGLHGRAYLHQAGRPLADATAGESTSDDEVDGMDCEAGVCFT